MDVGLNNKNTLGEVDPAFSDVVFLVEATSEEYFDFWKEWSKESTNNIESLNEETMNRISTILCKEDHFLFVKLNELNEKVKKIEHTRVDWKDVSSGFSITIGHIKKMPVCVSFRFAFINGKKVCFYECTSRMTDHEMVENWLISRFQLTNDGYTRWNHVDAANFHNCINSLDRLDKKSRDTVYLSTYK